VTDREFWQGFWRLADPKISLASFAGLWLGACAAAADSHLSWSGLGELAVAIAYGPLIVCGTYFVQTGDLSAPLLHVSCALGLHIAAFLWINEFPDSRADLAAGKRNLIVRLGTERASFAYVLLITTAYCWLGLTSFVYPSALGYLWGFAGLPLAIFSAWRLLNSSGNIPPPSSVLPTTNSDIVSVDNYPCRDTR